LVIEQVLFVDLENVQKLDLTMVPASAHVMIFYGVTQKKLPEELVVQAQPLGARLKWIKISGQGTNALDFHIAFYLGRQLTQSPKSECVILSRDAGFDPLVRHLASSGHACRRVITLKDAFPLRPSGTGDSFSRLIALLQKEKSRPSKLKGLTGKVKSWFQKLPDEERDALIKRLFSESYAQESGASLIYSLDR
jgi:hypothetical protein